MPARRGGAIVFIQKVVYTSGAAVQPIASASVIFILMVLPQSPPHGEQIYTGIPKMA
jgi:hypothetical protein